MEISTPHRLRTDDPCLQIANLDCLPGPTIYFVRVRGATRARKISSAGNHQPIRVQMFSYGDYEPFPPSARCHRGVQAWTGAAESGYNVIG